MSEEMKEVQDTVSLGVRSLLARIENYAQKMAPGKRLTEDQINMEQKGLYLTIQSILTQRENKDFIDAFNGTIDLFKQYGDGALSSMFVSRNHYSVKLDSNARRDFAAWVNIFIILSKPNLRHLLIKQTDPEKAYRALPEIQMIRAVDHIKRLLAYDAQTAA